MTPDWEKLVYSPERVSQWLKGDITLRDLNAISGPEMLEMAVIGFSMYEHGRYEEAKAVFLGLSALEPKEAYYLTALGAVYLAEENLEKAKECFDRSMALDDRELATYVNRGEVYLRQGKLLEAAYDFQKAVDLDPSGEDPLSTRARILAGAALETLQTSAPKKTAPAKTASRAPVKATGKKK